MLVFAIKVEYYLKYSMFTISINQHRKNKHNLCFKHEILRLYNEVTDMFS